MIDKYLNIYFGLGYDHVLHKWQRLQIFFPCTVLYIFVANKDDDVNEYQCRAW